MAEPEQGRLSPGDLGKFSRATSALLMEIVNTHGVKYRIVDGSHVMLYPKTGTRPFKVSASRQDVQNRQILQVQFMEGTGLVPKGTYSKPGRANGTGRGREPRKSVQEQPVKTDRSNTMATKGPYRTEWVNLTPEMAVDLLSRNEGNRKVRRVQVARMASDMAAGRYIPTHQGIAIGDDGRLVDGQHRCHAVVESGVTIPILVVTGLSQQAVRMVDIGAKRLVSDFRGGGHAKTRASAAGILVACDRLAGTQVTYQRLQQEIAGVTDAERHMVLDDEDGIGGDLLLLANLATQASRRIDLGPAPLLAVSAMYPTEAERFLNGLSSGVGMEHGDPRLALRNFVRPRALTTSSGWATLTILKAMNAYADNRAVRLLRSPSRDEAVRIPQFELRREAA